MSSCLRKLLIKNPVLPENEGNFDKHGLLVPCGKCPACRKQRSNDWKVRAYYEYISKPYDIFFVTLDFDDEHIPLYHRKYGYMRELSRDATVPGFKRPPKYFQRFIDNPNFSYKDPFFNENSMVFPCFDSKLLKYFFDRLRLSFPDFRYLYVSDFGDAFERPHYHVAFFVPRGSDKAKFFELIKNCWPHGHHQDLQTLYKSIKSPLAGISYMTNYVTKDISFARQQAETSLPNRFRSQTHASIGFGDYALKIGDISEDSIRAGHKVYIDFKGNGIPYGYNVPRYYYQKLCYDNSWDSDLKKTTRTKNSFGREMDALLHNCDYVRYFEDFVNSRTRGLQYDFEASQIFSSVYPDSPYNGLNWKDIVEDVLTRSDEFKEFLFYKSCYDSNVELPKKFGFFKRLSSRSYYSCEFKTHYYRSLSCKGFKRSYVFFTPDVDLFVQATFLFDITNILINRRICIYKSWQASEDRKKRVWNAIRARPDKLRYLKRKRYNFNQLTPQNFEDYVSFNQS